jgi:predicted ATPase
MLLEHPEDGIHRALLRKLIDLLQTYSDQTQLIVASHSSIVFNTLDPGAIRLVTMEEDGTQVRALTAEELQVAGRFLEEEGSLSDFIETIDEG